MPGVPSSRGCDECRKQKKKCHAVNGTNQCSRCQRLSLECIGLGKQRFKFLDEGKQLAVRNARSIHISDSSSSASSSSESPGIGTPQYELANKLTRLVSSFAFIIDDNADIRIQMPWNFGPFLNDVPRRLGCNEALDAASEFLVAAYSNFAAGRVVASPDVMVKHSKALSALRRCLDNPVKAYSSETLCSTMLLIISQTLLGLGGQHSRKHSVGAAQVLKARGYTGPKDEFESKLLLSLRGPVAMEGLVNGKVHMTSQQWRDLVYNEIDNDTVDGQMMACLARLPDLMSRGRYALKTPTAPPSSLVEIQQEVRNLHESYGLVLKSLRDRWQYLDLSQFQSPRMKAIMHSHFSRSYGMALCTGIILNCIYIGLVGDVSGIRQESSQLADESLVLAEVADQYRPLGSIYVLVCLVAAWVGAIAPTKREKIRERLLDYQKDVQGRTATTSVADLEALERRFYLISIESRL